MTTASPLQIHQTQACIGMANVLLTHGNNHAVNLQAKERLHCNHCQLVAVTNIVTMLWLPYRYYQSKIDSDQLQSIAEMVLLEAKFDISLRRQIL